MNDERRPWPVDLRFLAGEDGTIVGPRGHVLQAFPDRDGYLRINRYVKGVHSQHSVHVIVCEAFHGPRPEGMQAAHRNGVHTDNRPANLRWAVPVENEADKLAHGRRLQGEGHHQRKLTEREVLEIRASSESSYVLARRYPVSPAQIRRIRARKGWTHV